MLPQIKMKQRSSESLQGGTDRGISTFNISVPSVQLGNRSGIRKNKKDKGKHLPNSEGASLFILNNVCVPPDSGFLRVLKPDCFRLGGPENLWCQN